jgi:hypothetical protein
MAHAGKRVPNPDVATRNAALLSPHDDLAAAFVSRDAVSLGKAGSSFACHQRIFSIDGPFAIARSRQTKAVGRADNQRIIKRR